MSENPVLTIGHSNHAWPTFSALLAAHAVDALADVRSVPFSRYNPQFSRRALEKCLAPLGVAYVFMGDVLGGRPDDPACYRDGRVCYDRVAETAGFRRGIQRVRSSAADCRQALMCAEKDPLDCHRTLLVARALDALGVPVVHILADGGTETHSQAMDRLLASFDLEADGDLFTPRNEFVATAIELQSRQVGFNHPTGDYNNE